MEKRTNKFLIGFDRYVQLDWCALTLEAAVASRTTDDVKDQISTILNGAESRRKTFDILKRLWLQPIAGYEEFSKRGVIARSKKFSAEWPKSTAIVMA